MPCPDLLLDLRENHLQGASRTRARALAVPPISSPELGTARERTPLHSGHWVKTPEQSAVLGCLEEPWRRHGACKFALFCDTLLEYSLIQVIDTIMLTMPYIESYRILRLQQLLDGWETRFVAPNGSSLNSFLFGEYVHTPKAP